MATCIRCRVEVESEAHRWPCPWADPFVGTPETFADWLKAHGYELASDPPTTEEFAEGIILRDVTGGDPEPPQGAA